MVCYSCAKQKCRIMTSKWFHSLTEVVISLKVVGTKNFPLRHFQSSKQRKIYPFPVIFRNTVNYIVIPCGTMIHLPFLFALWRGDELTSAFTENFFALFSFYEEFGHWSHSFFLFSLVLFHNSKYIYIPYSLEVQNHNWRQVLVDKFMLKKTILHLWLQNILSCQHIPITSISNVNNSHIVLMRPPV